MPKWYWLLALAVILAVLLWLRHPFEQESAKPVESSLPPGTFQATDDQWSSFRFYTVSQGAFHELVETEGKIAGNDDAATAVFSPYSGRVTKIFVKAGDNVKRGAPLIAIAASEFVQGQNDLVAAKQGLDNAEAQLKLATLSEKREHALFDAKTAAMKDWQQAQAESKTAESNYRTAEIALTAARNRLRILGKSDAEITALETSPKTGAISAEALVPAPISGVVTQRQVGVGEYINSASGGASSPIFTISDLSTVWGLANVRETDAPKMHVDQPVEVKVLAYPDRVFKAKLTYVAPIVDPVSHRLPVRAQIDNESDALKPEMFANFSIITGQDASGISVPEEAVIFEGDTARVWVAAKNKSIELRQIRVGSTHDGIVEVTDGLKADETVVTSGSLFIDRAAKNADTPGDAGSSPVAAPPKAESAP